MSRTLSSLIVLAWLGCTTSEPEEPAPTPDGGGGAGGSGVACVDHAASGCGSVEDCPWDESCGTSARTCPDGERCCTLALACAPHRGARPGGVVCEDDVDCGTGLCLAVGADVKLCVRACDPATSNGCVEGSHCAVVDLGDGATTTTCLGGTASDPEPTRSYCRHDGDCLGGRICRMKQATDLSAQLPIGACEPRPEGIRPDDGALCGVLPEGFELTDQTHPWAFSEQCLERGLCVMQCNTGQADACECDAADWVRGSCTSMRCATTCSRTDECPPRQTCQQLKWIPGGSDEALEVPRVCLLPHSQAEDWGCWDELDCCRDGLQPNGRACCEVGDACTLEPLVNSHCALRDDSLGSGRALTACLREVPNLAAPGASCVVDADCQSRVCVPDGGGGKWCSSPCEAARDRCEQILPGTACRAAALENGLCLDACRAPTAAEPACEP